MLACGRFTAPCTWPRRKCSGLRTSRSTKSDALPSSDACTSQQSVSSSSRRAKCCRASAGPRAGTSLTGERDGNVGMSTSSGANPSGGATGARLAALPSFGNTLPMAPSNRRVVVLAYDGLCTFEFALAIEIFALKRPELGVRWYDFAVCAVDRGPLRAMGGVTISARQGLRSLVRAGTVVVPGWRDLDRPPPRALVAALQRGHEPRARLGSI